MSEETLQSKLVRLLGDALAEAQDGNLLAAMEEAAAARMYWEDAGQPEDAEDIEAQS